MMKILTKPEKIDTPVISFMDIANKTDTEYLKRIVYDLDYPRPTGTKANIKARSYVMDAFYRLGFDPIFVNDLNNVIVHPQARVFIGSHYDTVETTPGADDNTSAVAVMLGVAKNLGVGFGDIGYICFNAEENGLVGSTQYVQSLKDSDKKSHHVIHVLEMVGYTDKNPNSQQNPLPMGGVPSVGDFLAVVGNNPARNNVKTLMNLSPSVNIPVLALQLGPIPASLIPSVLKLSDHAPFWDEYMPALQWTDTAFHRNPNYHRPTDTADTLDYEFMTEVTKLLTLTTMTEAKAIR